MSNTPEDRAKYSEAQKKQLLLNAHASKYKENFFIAYAFTKDGHDIFSTWQSWNDLIKLELKDEIIVYPNSNPPTKWPLLDFLAKCNYISVPKIRMVWDVETKDQAELEQVRAKLNPFNYEEYDSGGRGVHFEADFPELKQYSEVQVKQIKENMINWIGSDIKKGSKKNLIGLVDTPHRRTGKPKTLVNKNISKNQNKIPKVILSKISSDKKPDKQDNAVTLMKRYGLDKTDAWLFDIIDKQIRIKEDTGGNSMFFKSAAILCNQENIPLEDRKVIYKALAQQCDKRTYAAVLGWDRKVLNNKVGELNLYEINKAIDKGQYELTKYDPSTKYSKISKAQEGDIKFWTIQDYDSYKPNRDYIIQSIAHPSEIGMNYGQSGSFKSLWMLYKAICIASGRKLLDKFKVKQNPVAILSAENSKRVDKDRLYHIRRGMKLRKKDIPIYILPRNDCGDILNAVFRDKVYQFVKEHRIKALFIDTINPVTPEIDDNKAADVTRVFNNFLKELSDSYGCYVEFLHHTDKQGNRFLGSTKWKANCDFVTRTERMEELGTIFKLFNEKNRDGETETLEVNLNFIDSNNDNKTDIITFDLISESAPAVFKKQKKPKKKDILKNRILEIVIEPTSRKDLCGKLIEKKTKFNRSTLDRAIAELKAENKLISENGVYSRVDNK